MKTEQADNNIEEIEKKINDYIHEQINKNEKIPYDYKPFTKPIKEFMLKLLGLNK